MAGSSMTFTEIVFGSVKKIKCVWLSDDGTGDVSGTTTNFYDGRILGLALFPMASHRLMIIITSR